MPDLKSLPGNLALSRRFRPYGDDLDDWYSVYGGAVTVCGVGGIEPPCLDVDEVLQAQRERREAMLRRRPCGFTAAWPEEPPAELRRVA